MSGATFARMPFLARLLLRERLIPICRHHDNRRLVKGDQEALNSPILAGAACSFFTGSRLRVAAPPSDEAQGYCVFDA